MCPPKSLSEPGARCSQGGVPGGVAATASPPATAAACEMLRCGGNAIDAAVAAAWALAVCEPGNSGLGGQTTLLVRLSRGRHFVIDGHSRAPAAVSPSTVSCEQQRRGHRATTVPSTPMILETARQRYGTLSRARVLEPAIRLAEEGYAVTPLHRRQLTWCLSSLIASPITARFFLDGRQPWPVGAVFRQPTLAATLRRIAQEGAEDFYQGRIARDIAEDMRRQGGLLTREDLAGMAPPAERQPISLSYRGRRVVSVPPPGGGWRVLLGLGLLAQLNPGDLTRDLCRWYELTGEITQAVFLETERLAGEIDRFVPEAYVRSLSEERTSELSRAILEAENVVSAGDPPAEDMAMGITEEPGETTHLCTVDREGNVVSLTQSLQSLFGARAVCEPCGFLYNNYLLTCPRKPHAHQLRSRCLPRSNTAPTFFFSGRDSHAVMSEVQSGAPTSGAMIALGAAGSRRIVSAILQTIGGVVERGLPLPEAVAAPRLHVKLSRKAWLERSPETEPLVPRLLERFEAIRLRDRYSYAMGCVQAIQVNPDGTVLATADPRREGTAGVVP